MRPSTVLTLPFNDRSRSNAFAMLSCPKLGITANRKAPANKHKRRETIRFHSMADILHLPCLDSESIQLSVWSSSGTLESNLIWETKSLVCKDFMQTNQTS